jgi:hypothetical protein
MTRDPFLGVEKDLFQFLLDLEWIELNWSSVLCSQLFWFRLSAPSQAELMS